MWKADICRAHSSFREVLQSFCDNNESLLESPCSSPQEPSDLSGAGPRCIASGGQELQPFRAWDTELPDSLDLMEANPSPTPHCPGFSLEKSHLSAAAPAFCWSISFLSTYSRAITDQACILSFCFVSQSCFLISIYGFGFWLHTHMHTHKNLKAEHVTVMGKNLALSLSSSRKHVAMMIITYFQKLQLELQITLFFFLWHFILQTPLKLPGLTALVYSLCCIQMYIGYSIWSLQHL